MVQNIALWLGAFKVPPLELPPSANVVSDLDEMRALFPNGIHAADLG